MMEERPYKSANLRALLIASPFMLLFVAGMIWLAQGFASGSPAWYVWALTIVCGVAGGVVHQLVLHRSRCPECGDRNMTVSHGGKVVYLTCKRCNIRWKTTADVRQP